MEKVECRIRRISFGCLLARPKVVTMKAVCTQCCFGQQRNEQIRNLSEAKNKKSGMNGPTYITIVNKVIFVLCSPVSAD